MTLLKIFLFVELVGMIVCGLVHLFVYLSQGAKRFPLDIYLYITGLTLAGGSIAYLLTRVWFHIVINVKSCLFDKVYLSLVYQ